jgi:hypothetical protein
VGHASRALHAAKHGAPRWRCSHSIAGVAARAALHQRLLLCCHNAVRCLQARAADDACITYSLLLFAAATGSLLLRRSDRQTEGGAVDRRLRPHWHMRWKDRQGFEWEKSTGGGPTDVETGILTPLFCLYF